jgi:hypothetical protein
VCVWLVGKLSEKPLASPCEVDVSGADALADVQCALVRVVAMRAASSRAWSLT